MKVRKYPQSHLVITKDNQKIIIDPGNITFSKGFKIEEFVGADGYLITHQHADHMDPENIRAVVASSPVFGNADVVAKLNEFGIKATVVSNRQKFNIKSFEIEAVDLPHCKMTDGTDGPPNTGFIIDRVLFHPGDGDEDPGVRVDNFALPIAGPSINMSGALKFAQDVNAKVVIPIHYDSRFPANTEEFKKMIEPLGIEIRVLAHGEETEI
ncbi:MBL fold metallo-hydrolase [Candidatus Daviesbacteria bacterium]|nr:MBL fold metallo-hydrolase [Candidatus Daviesbacteria bacterium]